MSSSQTVLIVDDQPDDVEAIKRHLDGLGLADCEVVETAEAACTLLADTHFDLYVFDLTLPDSVNLELLARLAAAGFVDWHKSIVITGVVEAAEQDMAIERYGVPVLDKDQLDGRLRAWARSILDVQGTQWVTRIVAALGAALWGTGACSFAWLPGVPMDRVKSLFTPTQTIGVGDEGVLVALPNNGLKATVALRDKLLLRLGKETELRSLVLTDLDGHHDLYRLAQDVLSAVRRPGFTGAIWPLAELPPRAAGQ